MIFFFFQVGYPTALDIFIIICFVTVFAALVEFAILNFIDTLIRRIKKRDKERRAMAMAINQTQNSFYIHPGTHDRLRVPYKQLWNFMV